MSNVIFKDYPYYSLATLNDVILQVGQITHTRKDDILQVQNLPNIFVAGRTVGKIPTSSADVAVTDRVGDQAVALDGSYLYILVDNSGTAEWRRVALGSF